MVKKKQVSKKPRSNIEIIAGLKAELNAIKAEIQNDVVGPVVASFGFIIALIWRDAIRATINVFLTRSGLLEKAYIYDIVSAIIVTIFVIAIMITVTKLGHSKKKERIKIAIKQAKKKL